MRISAVHITDYKRVHDVAIEPDADRSFILIGGRNRQGKSSILDALSAAFGGAASVADDPVRHGAESAAIEVQLDGGKLVVRRVIDKAGKTTLEVRDEMGPIKAPQKALADLIGARFMDPLEFLALEPKKQRAKLMQVIDGAGRIADLDIKRERFFTKRTEVGRKLEDAEGEVTRLGATTVAVGEPIDVAALVDEQRRFAGQQRNKDSLTAQAEMAARDRAAADELVGKIERELAKGRTALEKATEASLAADAAACASDEAWGATAARRDQIDAEIARAGAHNRAVNAAEAVAKRREEAAAVVAALAAERAQLTAYIEKTDERKAEILGAAQLPVEGLGVTETGVTLAGVSFEQASGAEKMRVAVALAVASSPGLDDIWVKDGALLDDEMLAAIVTHAAAAKKHLWIERVGDRDPGVIVIQDGRIHEDMRKSA